LAVSIKSKINNAMHKDSVLIDAKTSRMVANAVTVSFLLIHISLFILFALTGVRPMAIFNVFSIAFYIFCFYISYRAWYRGFVLLSLIEVLLHMTAAVYYTGWENGFQISLVGITVMLVISEYLGRMMDTKTLPTFPLCGLVMMTYILEYIISFFHTAPYTLPVRVTFWLNIAWALSTFIISVGSMISFVWLVFSTQSMLTRRAARDNLTGLSNRSGIRGILEDITESRGLDGCWAAMMDIDDFKVINDTYGHLCGDYVLREVARLMEGSNVDAYLSRWGGEEFLAVGYTDGNMQLHLDRLENFRKDVESHDFVYNDTHFSVTLTIGVAEYVSGESLNEWIDNADKKLYEGKRSGKNKVVS